MQLSCPGCGARVPEGIEQCDLCGTPLTDDDADYDSDASETAGSQTPGSDRPFVQVVRGTERVYCNQCGAANPWQSNFCSTCGVKIVRLDSNSGSSTSELGSDFRKIPGMVPAPPETDGARESAVLRDSSDSSRPTAEPGAVRQVGILVGAGLMIVVVWYIGSIVLDDRSTNSDSSEISQVVGVPDDIPIPQQFIAQEVTLQEEIESLTGIALDSKRRELIDLYVSANRLDRAAGEAEKLAESDGSEQMWVATANLYYDWMESQTPVERAYFARKSIAAYRHALEINPENLDARTDMAIAYMYDSENPMMAIQETMKVLESDSLHVNANFNRAIMLLQINRVDQAIEQLRKVKRIVGDPDNAVYIQADQLITDTIGKRNG